VADRMETVSSPTGRAPARKRRRQPAYKSLRRWWTPLGSLPPQVASQVSSLAERKPAARAPHGDAVGPDVARRMGVPVIPDDRLRVGKCDRGRVPQPISTWSTSPEVPEQSSALVLYILPEGPSMAFVNIRRPSGSARWGAHHRGMFVGCWLGAGIRSSSGSALAAHRGIHPGRRSFVDGGADRPGDVRRSVRRDGLSPRTDPHRGTRTAAHAAARERAVLLLTPARA